MHGGTGRHGPRGGRSVSLFYSPLPPGPPSQPPLPCKLLGESISLGWALPPSTPPLHHPPAPPSPQSKQIYPARPPPLREGQALPRGRGQRGRPQEILAEASTPRDRPAAATRARDAGPGRGGSRGLGGRGRPGRRAGGGKAAGPGGGGAGGGSPRGKHGNDSSARAAATRTPGHSGSNDNTRSNSSSGGV